MDPESDKENQGVPRRQVHDGDADSDEESGDEEVDTDGPDGENEGGEDAADEDGDEEEEDEAQDEEPPFDASAHGLKEISNLASFTVSSYKPGSGVKELRDDDVNQFWQ
jgi:anaphase-promoting complex subunit 10